MNAMNWIDSYLKAGNIETSTAELRQLARSSDRKVRARVAENTAAPRDLLEALADDSCADVRLAVSLNRSAPVDLIYRMAYDEDPTVRHGLAEASDAPRGVLRILANDDNPYVSCRARKTICRLSGDKFDQSDGVFFMPTFRHGRYA